MTKKDQFLIFRDAASTEEAIRGIWFHDGEERDNFLRYVENVVKAICQIEETEQSKAVETKPEENKDATNAGAALLATLNLGSNTESMQTQAETNAKKTESAAEGDTNNSNNIVLDKKSLQLSLLSLIQDERFLDLIHAQYVKVSNARNAREQQASKDRGK